MFLKNVKLQSDGGFLGASVSRGYRCKHMVVHALRGMLDLRR